MIDYKLAKKLKDAGFPLVRSAGVWSVEDKETGDRLPTPTLSELISEVKDLTNEIAIGWNDSGCFWHIQYGNRGAGNMMEGIGHKIDGVDGEELEELLAKLWLKLNEPKNI